MIKTTMIWNSVLILDFLLGRVRGEIDFYSAQMIKYSFECMDKMADMGRD